MGNNDKDQSNDEHHDSAKDAENRDGIYRPPRLAAMPYTEAPRERKARRQPVPSALAALMYQDPTRPHVESTSGLAAIPSLASNRAREIQRMTEFEEENFTRIIMKKKDAKQRRKDEADIALGGSGAFSGQRRGGGFEDEFADVLRSVGRSRVSSVGDGYEELRKRGKRGDVLSRSRTRARDEATDEIGEGEPRMRKRTRFEKEAKVAKKKLLRSRH
jgi:U3 small nucleolar ribonucleoprotein protein LCP5